VHFNLLLAAVSTVPVVATGLAARQWALEGQKLKGILLMHLIAGSISSVLIWGVYWIHFRARRHPEEPLPNYRLPVEAFAALFVGLAGHLCGFLSGVTALDRRAREIRRQWINRENGRRSTRAGISA
jgi:hypothetical protein